MPEQQGATPQPPPPPNPADNRSATQQQNAAESQAQGQADPQRAERAADPAQAAAPRGRRPDGELTTKAYVEARDSIEELRAMRDRAWRDPSDENRIFARQAEDRTRNAIRQLWQDPVLATALAASGSTPQSMTSDLDAQRYDRVAFFVAKANPPLNIDDPPTANIMQSRHPIPATDPNPELAAASRTQPSSQEPSRQSQGQQADPQGTERPADPAQGVVREIADKLCEAATGLAGSDRALAQQANELAREANDQVRANQRSFQHELAYIVQDVEKARGSPLPLSDQARAEVTRLAASAPGLENDRLKALLRSTASIDDQALVRELRRAGTEIGQQADQNTANILSRIEAFESRVRLADRPQPAPEPAEAAQTTRNASNAAPSRMQAGASSDPSAQQNQVRRQEPSGRPNLDRPIVVETGFTGALMDGIFRAMRPAGSTNTPPWEAGAQPFGQRLAAFEENTRDDKTLRGAERSGRAALEAMEGFRNGEGAAVLNRIREAAKIDPGGMAGVLSQMRAGGKFADLRQQFNTALSHEHGAAAAYDKAASALARYGEDRKAVEQVIAKRPDATNLSAKFETLDKEIGAAASEIPSRRDGKTMLDDLGKQVAEMLQRALDSVKNLFRGASPGASPGPSPS